MSNHENNWDQQVIKSLDASQSADTSAEVLALRHQLHEKEQYITSLEVRLVFCVIPSTILKLMHQLEGPNHMHPYISLL